MEGQAAAQARARAEQGDGPDSALPPFEFFLPRLPTETPQRGSCVTANADVIVEDGKITEFAQDVKACALGQAAAGIVGQNILGCTREQLAVARAQLSDMLKSEGAVPDAPFSEFEVLIPAREFTNRHASILLSFDAALGAFDEARKADCA